MRRLLPALGCAFLLTFLPQAPPALAQQERTTLGGEEARIVHSTDRVQVLKVEGTEINSRTENFPGVHLDWYVVQDSSLGLVFRGPSGLKIGNQRRYDGDIDLRALDPVTAFELTALTFSIWDEHVGTFHTSYRVNFEAEDEESFDPRWLVFQNEDHRHLSSIIYISRVRHSDGSISVANTAPVHHIAQMIDEGYTPEPEQEDLENLLELWREFLKRLQGWSPPATSTSASDIYELRGTIN